MADTDISSLTERLQEFMLGGSPGTDPLFEEVMPELLRLASRELRREGSNAPVSRTELVNELWLRNLSRGGWTVQDRRHFYALAGVAMRRVLVDLARARLAKFRGSGERPISLDDPDPPRGVSVEDDRKTVEIDIALERVAKKSALTAHVINLHHFCGFTLDEVGEKTGISASRARTLWEEGKKLLMRELTGKRTGPFSGLRLKKPPAEGL